VGLAPLKYFN